MINAQSFTGIPNGSKRASLMLGETGLSDIFRKSRTSLRDDIGQIKEELLMQNGDNNASPFTVFEDPHI